MYALALKLALLKHELGLDKKFIPEYYNELKYDLDLGALVQWYEFIYKKEFGELPRYGEGCIVDESVRKK